MAHCICDDCKHLKSIVLEEELVDTCDFGFPSEACSGCEAEGCDAVCEHHELAGEAVFYEKHCCICGKALSVSEDVAEDKLFCTDCYFKQQP